MRKTKTRSVVLASMSLCFLMIAAVPRLDAGVDTEIFKLRVDDVVAPAGSTIGLVVRSYAPRPIRQGQVCFRPRRTPAQRLGRGDSPFAEVVGVAVFGGGKSKLSAELVGDMIVVTFDAPRAINEVEGPIFGIYLKLRGDVLSGDQYTLDVDLPASWIVDASGAPLPFLVRPGTLDVSSRAMSLAPCGPETACALAASSSP